MNEFIVWDGKEFINKDEYRFVIDLKGMLLERSNTVTLIQPNNKHKYFNYIGKTDISDKKIYADCSVFEFEFTERNNKKFSYTGWFEFNYEDLRYEINILNNSKAVCLWYDNGRIDNLKIIGTLQENPELLK